MKSTLALSLLSLGIIGHTPMVMAQSPGTFTATGNLTRERMFHAATLLTNGRVLITGGFTTGHVSSPGSSVWANAELYDPSTGTFTATGNMITPRYGHTATLLPGGKVLIAGGGPASADFKLALTQAELYDPATGTFSAAGNMTTARSWHTATLLNSGKVLIAGGFQTERATSAELYDPSTGTFTATGSMLSADDSIFRTAAILSNGKVLVLHGRSDGVPASTELYDPDTGTFTVTSEAGHVYGTSPVTATLLTNGKVLVTLGYCCDHSKFAEVYDPSNGTFTATGNMSNQRGYSTATLLPDGRVLIAGRDDSHYPILGSADLYDPVTGAFSTTREMALQRAEGHTATLLPDGAVLMAGGWVCCGYSIATAEIYRPAVLVRSPVLFSVAGGAQGAILHSGTAQVVSASNPAVAGEALEIYLTGLTDGSLIPPQVAIGGRMAELLFFGKAPGFANLNQVNVRVPGGVTPGSSVGVRLTYLARPSNEVTIGVR